MRPQVRAIGASSNLGRRQAWIAQAALSVLSRRQATVIWPTPPGTGVYGSATCSASEKGDVADQTILAACASQTRDADIDHGGAGLDPVALTISARPTAA